MGVAGDRHAETDVGQVHQAGAVQAPTAGAAPEVAHAEELSRRGQHVVRAVAGRCVLVAEPQVVERDRPRCGRPAGAASRAPRRARRPTASCRRTARPGSPSTVQSADGADHGGAARPRPSGHRDRRGARCAPSRGSRAGRGRTPARARRPATSRRAPRAPRPARPSAAGSAVRPCRPSRDLLAHRVGPGVRVRQVADGGLVEVAGGRRGTSTPSPRARTPRGSSTAPRSRARGRPAARPSRRRRSSRRRPGSSRPTRLRRGRTPSTSGARRPGWPRHRRRCGSPSSSRRCCPCPGRARARAAWSRRTSPPHFASFTLTRSADRRRITSTRSRTPYTDSSAITGVETRAVTQAIPSRSAAGTGCSTSSTSRPASSRAPITRTASRGVQPWLASSRSRTSGPTAARTARDPLDVRGGVGADLHLEHREPVGDPGPGGAPEGSGVAGGQRDVGRHPQRGAAEQHRQAHAATPGGQVVQRDVHRRLGAVVGGHRLRERPAQVAGRSSGSRPVTHGSQRPLDAGLRRRPATRR